MERIIMKQLSVIITIAVTIFTLGSCASKSNQYSSKSQSTNDTVFGLVGPGSAMHTLQLCQSHPIDTLWFYIDDSTNVSNANLLIGNPTEVIFRKTKQGNEAIKIVGNSTYANAIGQWTMPDPIAPDKVMGIDIEINGIAHSIRMATLVYKSWELSGEKNQIILHGESIGNGVSFNFTDTATIATVGNEQILTLQGNNIQYKKQPF